MLQWLHLIFLRSSKLIRSIFPYSNIFSCYALCSYKNNKIAYPPFLVNIICCQFILEWILDAFLLTCFMLTLQLSSVPSAPIFHSISVVRFIKVKTQYEGQRNYWKGKLSDTICKKCTSAIQCVMSEEIL